MNEKELIGFLKQNLSIKAKILYFDYGADGDSGENLIIDLFLKNEKISTCKVELACDQN
jgi:hypothetical protein